MDIEKIKKANTKYIGKEIIYYKQIGSTQEYAKTILGKTKNGTIVITDNQTNGIGTKGRTWYSNNEKNITMTVIIYPNCDIKKLEGYTVKVAEAMRDTIKELYNINLKIKVPNDLIINNKKISGILTNSTTLDGVVKYLLVGIGFNVNEEKLANEISEIATSLKIEFDKEFSREDIIINFIEKLEKLI